MSSLLAPSVRAYAPFLPPELWLKIFDFATWVPEEAEDSDRHFRCGEARRGSSYRLLRGSLITKRYIILVCQRWRSLATPFLYERILIRRRWALSSLCSALMASKRDAELKDKHPLGWWTRRLHVSLRYSLMIPQTIHLDSHTLADIIRCLPNLAIVVLSLTNPQNQPRIAFPTLVLEALAETCHDTFQSISIPTFRIIPITDHWIRFLAASSGLQHIDCPYTILASTSNLPMMPSLISLTIASSNCQLYASHSDTNHFPSLKEVVYLQECHLDHTPFQWESFLRISGHNLTKVVLSPRGNMQTEINALTEFCPKLQLVHLDIAFDRWANFRPNLVLPPISILGLQCRQFQARSSEYTQMFETLATVTATALTTVRFLDHRNVNNIRDHHPRVFANALLLMKSRGLHLEDDEGMPLRKLR